MKSLDSHRHSISAAAPLKESKKPLSPWTATRVASSARSSLRTSAMDWLTWVFSLAPPPAEGCVPALYFVGFLPSPRPNSVPSDRPDLELSAALNSTSAVFMTWGPWLMQLEYGSRRPLGVGQLA